MISICERGAALKLADHVNTDVRWLVLRGDSSLQCLKTMNGMEVLKNSCLIEIIVE